MKNIVICCDGTGNEYGKNNTNVVDLYSLCLKDDQQVTFYDPGVGTGGWEYDEELGELTAKHDQATGAGLQKNVNDAYEFLMESYEDGDKIYLFGFSRGAFTVRALAGMLHKCGLLRPDNDNLLEYVAKLYNTDKKKAAKEGKDIDAIATGFKATFSRSCPVHFVGVWDTVSSLVMNAGKRFYDATLNPEVKFAYHAVSIDERRKDFPVCLWDEVTVVPGQTIEQVWFAGVHSNVGGWYDERGLSNISLQWMLGKAKSHGALIDEARASQPQYLGNPHEAGTPPGKFHESYAGFWRFRGSRRRKLPDGANIHKSVIDRIENAANKYKPENLPDRVEEIRQKYKIVD
ncbi:MAG: DUF2235 domain-containing protein [Pseudomonadota bacterium]|nr:MAG: DUF2235 domain-containing protein [Pseudomonadota bacterium]